MSRQKLSHRILGIALVFLLLAGCGAPAAAPDPGAAFSGAINVDAKAGSGSLSFSVSDTGAAIGALSISLQSANCNNMITMGSVEDSVSDAGITITDGAFEGRLPAMGGMVTDYRFNLGDSFPTPVSDPYTVGKIAGRFTTSTTASGKITIFLGAPMSGGVVCELGTFDWSASSK
jgi:hypothetical protein